MSGHRPAAFKSALSIEATQRRTRLGQENATTGSSAAEIRLPPDRSVIAGRRLSGQCVTNPSSLAPRRAKSPGEKAEEATTWQERERLPSEASGAQGPCLSVGLRVRQDDQRKPFEMVVDCGRVHAGVPYSEV